MDSKKPVFFLAAALILGLSACGGTPSEGAIQTAIAQTSIADEKIENAVNATLTALGKAGALETLPPATADFTSATSTGTST